MPFTLAHPAAVAPFVRFVRRPFATSALVVGSMAPDFEYFLRLRPVDDIGHTPIGLLVFCLPVGLCVVFIFHWVVKGPALLLLPWSLRCRLSTAAFRPPRASASSLLLLGSLVVVGAMTHLVWDGFTHPSGWAVQQVAALDRPVVTVAGVEIRAYKLLQHGGTLVGLGVLSYFVVRWMRLQEPVDAGPSLPEGVRLAVVATILGVAVGGGGAAGLWVIRGVSVRRLQIGVVESVVVGIAAFSASVLVYSVVYRCVTGWSFRTNNAPN